MAETTYTYTRTLKTGYYDIGYNDPSATPARVEPALIGEVLAAISVEPRMCCDGTDCMLIFPDALSGGDKTTLDTVVSDHKTAAP